MEYWLFGTHAVACALTNPRRRLTRICLTAGAAERLKGHMARHHPRPEAVEPRALEKILPEGAVHQGVAALAVPLTPLTVEQALASAGGRPLLLLDQVTDPHNVGAILRSAAAFGAASVVMTDRNAPPESGTLAKAASGALDVVPIARAVNLAKTIEECKRAGYWVAGLAGEAATAIREAKLTPKTALVLGAEGKGLRRLTAEHCDLLIRLPISSRMESLNVSNAAAVALYELMRDAAPSII